MINSLLILCTILIIPLLLFSTLETIDPICNSSIFRNIMYFLTLLNICFIVLVIFINFIFVTKETKTYNNIIIKELISSSRVSYYYIQTQDRDYLINKNNINIEMSNKCTFEVKVKIPKIKMFNLEDERRTKYIIRLK